MAAVEPGDRWILDHPERMIACWVCRFCEGNVEAVPVNLRAHEATCTEDAPAPAGDTFRGKIGRVR